jgi:4-hydroxy-tetrahydrodipicolinate synthase
VWHPHAATVRMLRGDCGMLEDMAPALPTAPTTPAALEPGVWAILPTPFTPDGAVDLASVATCVAFQRTRGVTGLIALGVFGEASVLTVEEMEQVLAAVIAAADGLPVVAGLDPIGTDEACALAARLAAAAAAAAVATASAAAPGLRAVMAKVPSADAAATAAHLRAVAAAAGCGVVVQDYPARTGVTIDADALADAVSRSGVAVAVKAEASPSAPAVARLVARLGGAVPVFGRLGGVGLLDELAAGAAGAMVVEVELGGRDPAVQTLLGRPRPPSAAVGGGGRRSGPLRVVCHTSR